MKEKVMEVVWNSRDGGSGHPSFYKHEGYEGGELPLYQFICLMNRVHLKYLGCDLRIGFSDSDDLEIVLYREETDEEEQERLNEEFYREINTLTGTLGDLVAKCEGDKMALAKAREISAEINKIINEKMRDHGNHSN